jgi:GT2 family glycosyltransferase
MNPYFQAFLALLASHPIKALRIAWWWTTRRRVRALGHLRAEAAQMPENYRLWLAIHQPNPQPFATSSWGSGDWPMLAVHVHLGVGQSLRDAVASVMAQDYPRWELYISATRDQGLRPGGDAVATDSRVHALDGAFASRAEGLSQVLQETSAEYVVPLAEDCDLTQGALLAFAQVMRDAGREAVFYADQDERNARGIRSTPWFKPEWDEDLFLAQDYLSAACAIPVKAARRTTIEPRDNGVARDNSVAVYALLLRLLTGTRSLRAVHVPYVAVTTQPDAWCRRSAARGALVQGATGLPVTDGPFGTLTVHHPLPQPLPKVSIIVPTRDGLDILRTCVEGVLYGTDYPNLELIIADNDSMEPATLAYFDQCLGDPRVKVVRWPHPYNYSAVNNFAATQADGAYLCLLNNDTEILGRNWLAKMVAQAVRTDVGAVGARLLYPDRSIQHAGVVIGLGNAAGHAHRGLEEGKPGYFAQALVSRTATAVTAACLVVAKDAFDSVGGLDEDGLAIAYNDVDLCLKLRVAGWRNVYEADAVLIHHESKTRGLDFAPEHFARYMRELAVFQQRWGSVGYQDPTHHPGLNPATEHYSLRL